MEESNFKPYPIQATFVGVRELYIKANRPPMNTESLPEDLEPRIRIKRSKYKEETKSLQVFVAIEIGQNAESDEEADKFPFHLRVELGAEFEVDEESFPKEKVEEWARVNSPFILFPYIREQIFSLTARCGFPPILLPLLEVPTIKIQRNGK